MREDLEYMLDTIDKIKVLVQVGARSEHHMEHEIFKRINDDIINHRDHVRRTLNKINDSKDQS